MSRIFPTAVVLLLTVLSGGAAADDARSVIERASRTMGASGLNSISYAGTAVVGNFGQSRGISFGLASTRIRNYTRAIDFARPASHVLGYAEPPAVQGGPPPGTFEELITPETPGWDRQLEIWVTPWGFLRGAAANAATVKSQKVDGVPYAVVTWVPAQKAPSGQSYKLVGYINAQNLVERVETWVEHPIFGDMHVEFRYSDYRSFGGVTFPGRIAERCEGMETFVAIITNVRANPPEIADLLAPASPEAERAARDPHEPAGLVVPAPLVAATGITTTVTSSEKIADGVYRINGAYAALAVELRDFAVVLGGGESEARGQAIIAETRRLIPNKPIKYVVNLHPHFDHAAVLPPFAAAGITILSDDVCRYFLEQALGSPRTLVGDALAKSKKKPKVEGVEEKLVLGDAMRSIELYHLERNAHSDGMLAAYLPSDNLLFTADLVVQQPFARTDLAALVEGPKR